MSKLEEILRIALKIVFAPSSLSFTFYIRMPQAKLQQ